MIPVPQQSVVVLCFISFLGFMGANNYCSSEDLSRQKKSIDIPVGACKVRKIGVLPGSVTEIENTRNSLAHFHVEEMNCDNNTIHVEDKYPVVIEEYPFSSFLVSPNARFGAQLVGQANRFLSTDKYPTDRELNKRQEEIFRLLSLAGVGIARDLMSYGTRRFIIEKEKGKYDFAYSDFLAELSNKYGIELIGRLSPHYGHPGKSGLPQDIEAYMAYVRAVVERYDGDGDFGCRLDSPDCYSKDDHQYPGFMDKSSDWAINHKIDYWEVLKEPSPGRSIAIGHDAGLTPFNAAKIYGKVKAVVDAIAPNARIYFGGMGPIGMGKYTKVSYFKEMLSHKAGSYIDVMGVSAFKEPVTYLLARYNNILQDFDISKPLWVGQTGASDRSHYRIKLPNGGSAEAQSIYVVKAYTEAFNAGAEKVFWGDFLDNSSAERRGSTIWDSTGLFETGTWKLKPAYYTYKLIATALNDFTDVVRISEEVYKFTFNNRSPIYIVVPD